jgi:uncharacterized membrane protein
MYAPNTCHAAEITPGGTARAACYLLGPLSGAFVLLHATVSSAWSVRFHAWNSILLGALWAAAWLATELLEVSAPSWFSGTLLGEIQFLLNVLFATVWLLQMLAAYTGDRFVPVPFLHQKSVRLTRRTERLRGCQRQPARATGWDTRGRYN